MRFLAKRFSEELLVEGGYIGIVMGLPEFLPFIFLKNRLDPGHSHFIGCETGLAAAADTSAGAGHYLNEVEEFFPLFNRVEEFCRVAETVGYRDFYFDPFEERPVGNCIGEGYSCCFDPFERG